MSEKKFLVIGAGSWGTAIANLIANAGKNVILSSSHQQVVDEINQKNSNQKSLPEIFLSKNVVAIKDFFETALPQQIKALELVFIVTPSKKVAEIFQKIAILNAQKNFSSNCAFIICSKGFVHDPKDDELELISDYFEEITGIENYAVLSGPNFAGEVAQGLPTITTIASAKKGIFEKIAAVLDGKNFRCVFSSFPRSAEICGIVKNVIAIGCGIVDGLELGMNAKAALVVKGSNEIQALCDHFETSNDLENPHGFGDIFLTCSSEKSRNYSLGKALACEKTYAEIAQQTQKTYEGFSSAKDLEILSKQLGIKLELSSIINEILTQKFSQKEILQKIVQVII